jgi:hypothetical protein
VASGEKAAYRDFKKLGRREFLKKSQKISTISAFYCRVASSAIFKNLADAAVHAIFS